MSRQQWGHGYGKGFLDGVKARASFRDYVIAIYTGKDNPAGDFAEDIARDADFPSNASKGEMIFHLKCAGAAEAVIKIFERLFKEWEEIK